MNFWIKFQLILKLTFMIHGLLLSLNLNCQFIILLENLKFKIMTILTEKNCILNNYLSNIF
jgi:hypothetical protein